MNYYTGKPISYMQKCLRKLSYYYPIFRVIVSGKFDENTRRAVIDFERCFNLKVTGVIDNFLYEKICEEYSKVNDKCNDNLLDFAFKLGDESDIIGLFQVFNNILSNKFSNIKRLELTNKMDEATVYQVKTLQDIIGDNISGVLTNDTLKGVFDMIKG